MSEQRLQPRALEKLVADENAERRRRQGRDYRVTSPVVGVRGGLPFFTEYGPTYAETPGLVFETAERDKRRTKGADVARLAGDVGTPGEGSPSRFVAGHLSIREVDAPALTVRKSPSGAVEVVIRRD